jgi:hypothetical protein
VVQQFLDTIYSGVDVERVWRRTEAIWNSDRWMNSTAWNRTVAYVAEQLAADGVKDVEIVKCAADGESEFFGHKAWMEWDVRDATLEILGGKREMLCHYRENPRALMTYSAPTPKDGIETELVRVDDGREKGHYRRINVKGKIVFTRRHGANVAPLAAELGAVGVLSDYLVPRDEVPCRQPMTLPELLPEPPGWSQQMQWMHISGSKHGLFGFALWPAAGERMRERMKRGPVRVRAKVDSWFSKGSIPAVTAVVPGRDKRGGQVLVLGHLFEQGANDNASGCAVVLEVASCLNALITRGAMPRPKRSIRLLLMLEVQGSAYYLSTHKEQIPKTLAALCLDNVGDLHHVTQTQLTVNLSPEDKPSFTDPVLEWIVHQWLDPRDRLFHWITSPYVGGTDNYIALDPIGIPCPWVGEANRLWHTTADTMESVDRRSLAHVSTISAAYAHFLASAGLREARLALALSAGHGERRLVARGAEYLEGLIARQRGAKALEEGLNAVGKERDRSIARLRTVLPMVDRAQQRTLEPAIKAAAADLRRCAQAQTERLKAAARQ